MAAVHEISVKDTAARADELRDLEGDRLVVNMGPSHPSTHGVLRIVIELDGETITKADPDIGYLHRGDEKIAENMTWNQFIPYTDRLDYLASRSLCANSRCFDTFVMVNLWSLPRGNPARHRVDHNVRGRRP